MSITSLYSNVIPWKNNIGNEIPWINNLSAYIDWLGYGNANRIKYAEFVRLTTPSMVYNFCNAAGEITVDGIVFDALGSLMSIGTIQRDIKATGGDMTVNLIGINPDNVALLLSNEIKGSKIEIWRGFFDANNQIITQPTLQFYKRYEGFINNCAIDESFNDVIRERLATCVLSCASFRTILNNRVSGVMTNKTGWQKYYANDTSMNRVSTITATYFDFGGQPQQGSHVVSPSPSSGTLLGL